MSKPVLSPLAVDRCVAAAIEAIDANLSPIYVRPAKRLTDHERNVLAAHLRAGFAEAFSPNWGSSDNAAVLTP